MSEYKKCENCSSKSTRFCDKEASKTIRFCDELFFLSLDL